MPASRVKTQESLLGFARDDIELNVAAVACAGIPVPPGATADPWAVKTSGGVPRALHGNFSTVEGVDVVIDCTQEQNGDFARSVMSAKARSAIPMARMVWWMRPGPRRAWAIMKPSPSPAIRLLTGTRTSRKTISEWPCWSW